MTRFSFLIATLVFAAQLVAARKVALLFTDVKFDDKLTIQVALKEYDHVIAVINAVGNQKAAHGDLLDFLSKMNPLGDYKDKLTVLRGGNIKGKPVSHEVNFIKPSQEIMDEIVELPYAENIANMFESEDKLDIFQIAPTHREYVDRIAEMDVEKNLYHLVHGFNSGQRYNDGRDETLGFLKNIGPKMFGSEMRKSRSLAKVVFTNNHASFINGAGSSQPYAKFLNGRVPLDHLEAAVRDPFHVKQLTNAARLLDEAKLIVVVNQLKRAELKRAAKKSAATESNLESANLESVNLESVNLESAKSANPESEKPAVPVTLESPEFPLADLPKHVMLAGSNDEDDEIADEKISQKRQAARTHYLAFLDAVEKEELMDPSLATHVREFLNGKFPLKSVYMKAINGDLPMDKLYGDEKWLLKELKLVGAVVKVKKDDAAVAKDQEGQKSEKEKNLEDVLYDAENPIVDELSEKNYKLEGLSDIVLRARKNLEGDTSEKMRKMLLAYHKALTPIVTENFHPETRTSMKFRWINVVHKAFVGDMTVEVCDANHVVVVRRALELQGPALKGSQSRLMEELTENLGLISGQGLSIVDESDKAFVVISKRAPFGFKDISLKDDGSNVVFAPAEKDSVWAQTLGNLTAEASFDLLDKYLLPAQEAAVSMVVDPVEQVRDRSLKKRRLF